MPFGKGRAIGSGWSRPANMLLGGWQVNGFTNYQSGTPLNIAASNTANLFNPVTRANNNGKSGKLTGDIHDRLNRYFDPSVFSQPAPFTFGNLSRRVADIRAPGIQNWDLSLFKEFGVTEKIKAQLRGEFLNAFNTVRFSEPNTTVTSTSFGVISTQANSPRQIQFALKLLW
jgi:hypothetical protein